MKSAILLSALVLAGCSVSQPVKTVKPDGMKHAICHTEHSVNAVKIEDMNPVTVIDGGSVFTVLNDKGVTVASSPELKPNANGNSVGFKNGLMYTKGINEYTGFYGVFDTKDSKRLDALTFDCR